MKERLKVFALSSLKAGAAAAVSAATLALADGALDLDPRLTGVFVALLTAAGVWLTPNRRPAE